MPRIASRHARDPGAVLRAVEPRRRDRARGRATLDALDAGERAQEAAGALHDAQLTAKRPDPPPTWRNGSLAWRLAPPGGLGIAATAPASRALPALTEPARRFR